MPAYFLSQLCLVSVSGTLEEVPLNPTSPRALLEEMHRQQLDRARRDIKFLGELIALDEAFLRDQADTRRNRGKESRNCETKTRRWERKLTSWQDERAKNPSLETQLRALDALKKLLKELWGKPTAPLGEVKPKP